MYVCTYAYCAYICTYVCTCTVHMHMYQDGQIREENRICICTYMHTIQVRTYVRMYNHCWELAVVFKSNTSAYYQPIDSSTHCA